MKLKWLAWIIRPSRFCLLGAALLALQVLTACATDSALAPSPTSFATATQLAQIAPTRTLPTITRTPTVEMPSGSPTIPATFVPSTQTPQPTRLAPTKTSVPAPTQLPAPTTAPTSAPTLASQRPASILKHYESTLTLRAYPYESFLRQARDAQNNFPFLALDKSGYEAGINALGVQDKTLRTVILENEYLKLTFLPDLGGRLLQMTYKPTGQNVFYNNKVLKPSPWGPPQQGGWLAVGGMEWALPVNEHGYEWGVPWEYTIKSTAEGITIAFADTRATDRVRARIRITLPRRAGYVIVNPRIENPTAAPQRVQFWINAMLALGAPNVSPNTRFYFPTDAVFVHSTGNSFIPAENVPTDNATAPRAPISFHNAGGRDLSSYANWQDYLGVFAADLAKDFVGAYNYDTQLGMVRVFPPQSAPGVKLFAFGQQFCCRSAFADDASDYFEIWGGLPRTFFSDDDVTLAPGETREWTEYWTPFARTGGLSTATRDVILFLDAAHGSAQLSAYSAVPRAAVLVLNQAGRELNRWQLTLAPDQPFHAQLATGEGELQLRLLDSAGNLLSER